MKSGDKYLDRMEIIYQNISKYMNLYKIWKELNADTIGWD
jgi:hypothetical protein